MKDNNKNNSVKIQPNLISFLSSLMAEGLIFLGELENPITKKKEPNLAQSKYIIDLISLIKEKTKGNLTAEEANAIDAILYELRMKYLEKTKAKN